MIKSTGEKKKKKQNKTQLGTDVLFKNYWKY